jgi:hypothetical protein
LISLLAKTPDEFLAVRTVGGLREMSGHELVAVNLMDFLALQSTAPPRSNSRLNESTIGWYFDIKNETKGRRKS